MGVNGRRDAARTGSALGSARARRRSAWRRAGGSAGDVGVGAGRAVARTGGVGMAVDVVGDRRGKSDFVGVSVCCWCCCGCWWCRRCGGRARCVRRARRRRQRSERTRPKCQTEDGRETASIQRSSASIQRPAIGVVVDGLCRFYWLVGFSRDKPGLGAIARCAGRCCCRGLFSAAAATALGAGLSPVVATKEGVLAVD